MIIQRRPHGHPARRRPGPGSAVAFVVAALLAALAAFPTAVAAAQGDSRVTWSVEPSTQTGPDGRISFRYEMDPGTTVDDYVTVSNYSDSEVAFRLYASDGVTTAAGVFDLLPHDMPPADAGSWVTLGESDVTIGPRQRMTVPFRVQVPADATPGDHPAGIVAAVGAGDAGTVAVERRVGARIHLRVAGEVAPRLEVAGLEATHRGGWQPDGSGDMDVAFDVVNTGNVRLQGLATVELQGLFGLWSTTVDLADVPEVLPRQQVRVTGTVEEVPPLLVISAAVGIDPATVGQDAVIAELSRTEGRTWAWAVPWFWVMVLALVGAVAYYVVRTRRRQQQALARALAAARAEGRQEAADVDADATVVDGAPVDDAGTTDVGTTVVTVDLTKPGRS